MPDLDATDDQQLRIQAERAIAIAEVERATAVKHWRDHLGALAYSLTLESDGLHVIATYAGTKHRLGRALLASPNTLRNNVELWWDAAHPPPPLPYLTEYREASRPAAVKLLAAEASKLLQT